MKVYIKVFSQNTESFCFKTRPWSKQNSFLQEKFGIWLHFESEAV